MSKFIGLVSAYAYAKSKGYTGTEEEFAILMAEYASVTETAVEAVRIATESAQSAAAASSDVNRAAATVTQQAAQVHDDAETSSESAATASEAKETAADKALDSEAYALGTRDGDDVGSSDPAYHNNAKWYAESVSASAQTASEAAQTATQKASDAQASASAAAESARTLTIDATLTQSGQAADAKATGKVKADVDVFKNNLLERTKLPVHTSAAGWALNSNYNSVADSDAALRKYSVTAGSEIFLTLEGYGTCTALFQSSEYVPSSGTNSAVKGDPIIGGFTGYIVVPDEATSLIVAQAKTNTTDAVYSLSFTDAMGHVIEESADIDMFAVGGISTVTGELTYASAVTFITEDFLPDDVLKVTPNTGYYISPYAYSHGEYIGCWNGTTFSTSSQSYIKDTVNLELLRESYPDYQWRILIGRLSADYPVDTIRPNIVFTRVVALSKDEAESAEINDFLNQVTIKRGLDTTNNLVLMHFSDIHGRQDRLKDIVDYYNAHSGYIDDILNTGDDVSGQFSDGLAWWDSVDGAENILRCIGNHDAVTSQAGGIVLDMATLANTFFTPYVSNWNLTSYTADTTYYYKDYDNGIRLIVLDCMHMSDTTQMSWLQDALDDALSNSKHVVIGVHYPVYPYTSVECGFTPVVNVAEDTSSVTNAVKAMIDSFQTAGGIFVCYLTGHEHHDRIMTPETYPNQLCVNITCASNSYSQCKNSDQSRRGKKYANAINLVAINPNAKIVTIKRIGADKDVLGRDRISMAYNYGTHTKVYG